MRAFSEYVHHPLFHSCWDTGHGNVEGAQYDQILALGDDLRAVHINDNRGAQEGVELSPVAQAFFDYATKGQANDIITASGVVPANG